MTDRDVMSMRDVIYVTVCVMCTGVRYTSCVRSAHTRSLGAHQKYWPRESRTLSSRHGGVRTCDLGQPNETRVCAEELFESSPYNDCMRPSKEFHYYLWKLYERMDQLEASQSSQQAQLDAETAKVQANEQKLVTVQQEVDALKASQANGQPLDFTALDAALASESAQADTDVADAAPAQPASPPVDSSDPSTPSPT